MIDPETRLSHCCDRCPAEWRVRIRKPGSALGPMQFCAHHYVQHEPALIGAGYLVMARNPLLTNEGNVQDGTAVHT